MECLLSLGRSEECLEMIRAEIARAPPTPRLHLMHAKLNLLFEKVKKYHTKYSSNFDASDRTGRPIRASCELWSLTPPTRKPYS